MGYCLFRLGVIVIFFFFVHRTENCPGMVTLMLPPHIHIQTSPPETTGPVDNKTFGFVGTHGVEIEGTQGIGVKVKTPRAAAVAAAVALATTGFAMVIHIPKDITFIMGTKSIIDATGIPQANTADLGITTNEDGVAPHEHLQRAPQTAIGITT
jgi:hypothetical protein